MNLSCHKMMTGGDTLTITCFTCGMPSSKEWAQKISSRPTIPPRPFYPFLVTAQPPAGAVLKDDGTTFICAFCHASLEAQWRNYERQPGSVPPANRKYNLYKFICAVCGVETYRKRVRTLPFQEFPFLANQRPAGSLTLGNNPLAVVCLDCSETLWAQSAEYDRWGLPVHKRRFNWLARPPPDPDSLEATVARLPSGETQLPRCPPTEPVIKPKEPLHFESVITTPVKVKHRNSKSESNSGGSDSEVPVRKPSLTLLESSGVHSQPPVVTVAPMSSHNTSLTVQRKDILSAPSNLSSVYGKYDGLPCGLPPPPLGHPVFSRSSVFPSSYGHYAWAGLDGSSDPYPYAAVDGLQSSSNASWPWLHPSGSSGVMHFPSYMPAPYTGRSYSVSEPYSTASHSYYPPSPEGNAAITTTVGSSAGTYLTPLPVLRSSVSPTTTQSPRTNASISSSTTTNQRHLSHPISSDRDLSPPPRKRSALEVNKNLQKGQEVPVKKVMTSKNGRSSISESHCTNRVPPKKSSAAAAAAAAAATGTTNTTTVTVDSGTKSSSAPVVIPTESTMSTSTTTTTPTFKPKSNAIRNHIHENLMVAKNWKKAALVEAVSASKDSSSSPPLPPPPPLTRGSEEKSRRQGLLMVKELSPSSSCSEPEPVDFSVRQTKSSSLGSPRLKSSWSGELVPEGMVGNDEDSSRGIDDDAMDLSLSKSHKMGNVPMMTSKKFMIAYLCQSERDRSSITTRPPVSPRNSRNVDSLDHNSYCETDRSSPCEPSGRRSVIVTTLPPKCDSADHVGEGMEGGKLSGNSSPEPLHCDHSDASNFSNPVSSSEVAVGLEENCDKVLETMGLGPRGVKRRTLSAGLSSPGSSDKKPDPHDPQVDSQQQQQQQSETQNGKLAEPNLREADIIEDYVQKVVGEYMQEAKQAQLLRRKFEADQEEFLSSLGLITLQKKSDVELNNLISRSKHQTLAPIKLRPGTPRKVQLDEEFENKLLQIAFDDPSLKICDLNDDEVAFLTQLDLKPATKVDKEKREAHWRFILTERMMRAKRGDNLLGGKKPWDVDLTSSKILSPPTKSPNETSQLGALSVTLPSDTNDSLNDETALGSSDLLRIAQSRSDDDDDDRNNSSCGALPLENQGSAPTSAACVIQPVISYPKYIPSYVSQTSVPSLSKNPEDSCGFHTLNAPATSKFITCGMDDGNNKVPSSTGEEGANSKISTTLSSPPPDPTILKVPIVSSPAPLIGSSKANVTDEEKLLENHNNSNNKSGCTDPASDSKDRRRFSANLDDIIHSDALNCENFINQINSLLSTTFNNSDSTATSKLDKSKADSQATPTSWPTSVAEWTKLKKYLRTRQSQIKMIEDKLRKREKQVLSHLRACTTNTH